jgi:hypothetical protein
MESIGSMTRTYSAVNMNASPLIAHGRKTDKSPQGRAAERCADKLQNYARKLAKFDIKLGKMGVFLSLVWVEIAREKHAWLPSHWRRTHACLKIVQI